MIGSSMKIKLVNLVSEVNLKDLLSQEFTPLGMHLEIYLGNETLRYDLIKVVTALVTHESFVLSFINEVHRCTFI